jgi:hypothetical protein
MPKNKNLATPPDKAGNMAGAPKPKKAVKPMVAIYLRDGLRGLTASRQIKTLLAARVFSCGQNIIWMDTLDRAHWRDAITGLGANGGGFLYVASMPVLADNTGDLEGVFELARSNNVTIFVVHERVKLGPSADTSSILVPASKLLAEGKEAREKAYKARARASYAGINAAAERKNEATKEKLAIASQFWSDPSMTIGDISRHCGLSATTLYAKLGKRDLPARQKGRPKKSDGFTDLAG